MRRRLMLQQFVLASDEGTLKQLLHYVNHAASIAGIEYVRLAHGLIGLVDCLWLMRGALKRPAGAP